MPTSFCQALLQGHILAIPDPDMTTVILPLLTPPYYAGPANAQKRAMQIQVLLSMGHDRLPKEEAGKLLDHRVQFLTSTQELRHLAKNFAKIAGDYLGEESPISLSIRTWTHYFDQFDWQYDKAFSRDPLFWSDSMDFTRKHV